MSKHIYRIDEVRIVISVSPDEGCWDWKQDHRSKTQHIFLSVVNAVKMWLSNSLQGKVDLGIWNTSGILRPERLIAPLYDIKKKGEVLGKAVFLDPTEEDKHVYCVKYASSHHSTYLVLSTEPMKESDGKSVCTLVNHLFRVSKHKGRQVL